MMGDSNNPKSSYSDDEEQYGHGEGFDLPSPWEDRMFWENRNANQNHFYRTTSTFTSSSTSTEGDDEVKVETKKEEDIVNDVESIGSDGEDDYQIMVCRGKDGEYHVRTSDGNMDEEVLAQFGIDTKRGSESVFRPEVKSEMKVPSLALASTNSSEWSEEDANECVEGLEYSSSSTMPSLLSIIMILSVATMGYVVATNVPDSAKLIRTAIGNPGVIEIERFSSSSHQEHDTVAAAVCEFEEYCSKGPSEAFVRLLFHITHLFQNLTNLNIWKEKAESLLTGALPMNWAGW
jgi:hypothetical protein